MSKKGKPKRPKLNVRITPEQLLEEINQFPEGDPFRDMIGDGLGIDFQLPLPPWDNTWRTIMLDNLAILRVDPNHSNYTQTEIAIVRTIAQIDCEDLNYEIHIYDLGRSFDKLLSEWGADTVEMVFKDILRMKKTAEEAPHRNYLAYLAYCDFLIEFEFEPTKQKLAKFIKKNPLKYPVGLRDPTTSKEWWNMFAEAGLIRLE